MAVINIVILALVLLIGFAYIVQVNRSTTKGYQIRDLETRIEQLGIENQRLEIEVAGNRSVAAVDERVKMLGMVPTETPDYVSAGTPTVALK
tara:strand:- start:273 stop:548 length:276 start_codon:yes stop_codon:yes gene_type:complete